MNENNAMTTPMPSLGFSQMMTPALMESASKQFVEQWLRVQMALASPRDNAVLKSKLEAYCNVPDFARAAVYAKPIGKDKMRGLSARFAEAAVPLMRNLDEKTIQVYDDIERQTWRVSVSDLETNTVYSEEVFIQKRTWRKYLRQGQHAIAERVNTQGEMNYLVEATDDEVNTLRAAYCSKVRRNLIIRHIPPEIKASCLAICIRVADDADAKDPDAARKAIVDSFLKIGIESEELTTYLGHSIRSISEKELAELRGVFVVIKDGEATWRDILAEKQEELAELRTSGGLNKVKRAVKDRQEKEQRKQETKPAQPPATNEEKEKPPEQPEGGRRRASRRRNEETNATTGGGTSDQGTNTGAVGASSGDPAAPTTETGAATGATGDTTVPSDTSKE